MIKSRIKYLSAIGFLSLFWSVLLLNLDIQASIIDQTAAKVIVFSENVTKRVLVPKEDIGIEWRRSLNYNDSAWKICSGSPGGIGYEIQSGYEGLITLDVKNDMHDSGTNPNSSCYIRLKFNVSEMMLKTYPIWRLVMRYDDGFIAYINSKKVASANIPDRIYWNSVAPTYSTEAGDPDSINISEYRNAIVAGENLLAIQGLNSGASSSDFLITVALTAEKSVLQDFDSSNLPLLYINTFGQQIPDENKITANLRIIDNGPGKRNYLSDTTNAFEGLIGIELRGSSSNSWRKKQYGFETRDSLGNNRNVTLLGLPAENDWVLYGPYIDRSLMRNILAFHLARQMGNYASRTRYCELFLNGDYKGIYVLMEKIKRDKNRVDIAELDSADVTGEPLTGGYIIKLDKWGNDGFTSQYMPINGSKNNIYYQYHYPKDDEILPIQKAYIQQYMHNFENVMASPAFADPEKGYPKYIDQKSFIDFLIISEITKNVDGYRLSTFMYKDRDRKDSKLHIGPVWDFNIAFGLANYYDGEDTDDWMLEEQAFGQSIKDDPWQIPFWWAKLFQEKKFANALKARWLELRQNVLDPNSISHYIDTQVDSLMEAQRRNFTIWTAPGQPKAPSDGFWPMPDVFYTFKHYIDEVNYLKSWLTRRINWIDANIMKVSVDDEQNAPLKNVIVAQNYPNPFNSTTIIRYQLPQTSHVTLNIFNCQGKLIWQSDNPEESAGMHEVIWDGCNNNGVKVASGMYFLQINFEGEKVCVTEMKKMVLLQ
ncbi:CotH kinase family protein [candidate division KSB1 bacterium]|nr:CotH kinase family protein [candidate division KSB1 bacterium]